MKKRTKILWIACAAALLAILSPNLIKIRCRIFLNNMDQKAAVYTVSETHSRGYTDPNLYLDSTQQTREWYHREAGVYVETVSTGGDVSYYLNGSYKSAETDYQWEQISFGGSGYASVWKGYTWEVLEAMSTGPASVRIADGLIQVVFHTVNTGANHSFTDYCFRFHFLLQFDSFVTESVTYADENYDPNNLREKSTTVRKIVSLDEDEIYDKIKEQDKP